MSAGIRGIVALLRQFKFYESQNGGRLDIAAFEQALIEFQIPYIKEDITQIFQGFDTNADGVLDLQEYIDSVTGPLSQYRSDRIELAWRRINAPLSPSVHY